MAKNARDALHRDLQLFAFAGHVFIVAFLEKCPCLVVPYAAKLPKVNHGFARWEKHLSLLFLL